MNFLDRFSTNTQISIFIKIRSVGAELFQADRQTDRQTDMTKLLVVLAATKTNRSQITCKNSVPKSHWPQQFSVQNTKQLTVFGQIIMTDCKNHTNVLYKYPQILWLLLTRNGNTRSTIIRSCSNYSSVIKPCHWSCNRMGRTHTEGVRGEWVDLREKGSDRRLA